MSITVKYTEATVTYSIDGTSMIMTDTSGKRVVIPDIGGCLYDGSGPRTTSRFFYDSQVEMLDGSKVDIDVGFELFMELVVEGLLNNEKLRLLLDGSKYKRQTLTLTDDRKYRIGVLFCGGLNNKTGLIPLLATVLTT